MVSSPHPWSPEPDRNHAGTLPASEDRWSVRSPEVGWAFLVLQLSPEGLAGGFPRGLFVLIAIFLPGNPMKSHKKIWAFQWGNPRSQWSFEWETDLFWMSFSNDLGVTS